MSQEGVEGSLQVVSCQDMSSGCQVLAKSDVGETSHVRHATRMCSGVLVEHEVGMPWGEGWRLACMFQVCRGP